MSNSPGMIGRLYASEVAKAMLAVGLVLLVATAVLIFQSEREMRQHHLDVQRVNTALLRIEEINSLVIGVDYSARGYALTGERLFFDHERQKQQRLKAAIRELASLVDQEQRPTVVALSRLADKHAKIYSDLVAKGPRHTEEIAEIITNPVQRQKRYAVLEVLQRLRGSELASLSAYHAIEENEQRRSSILTLIIVGLAFLGGTADLVARAHSSRLRRKFDFPTE